MNGKGNSEQEQEKMDEDKGMKEIETVITHERSYTVSHKCNQAEWLYCLMQQTTP